MIEVISLRVLCDWRKTRNIGVSRPPVVTYNAIFEDRPRIERHVQTARVHNALTTDHCRGVEHRPGVVISPRATCVDKLRYVPDLDVIESLTVFMCTLSNSGGNIFQRSAKIREVLSICVRPIVVLDIDCITAAEGDPTCARAVELVQLAS